MDANQPACRRLERRAPQSLRESRGFSIRRRQKGPVHADRQGTGSDSRLRDALAAADRPRRRGQGRWSTHQRRRPRRPRFQCGNRPDQGRDSRYAHRPSGVAYRGRGGWAGRGFPALHCRKPGRRVARSYDPRRRSERRRQARSEAGTADRQPRRDQIAGEFTFSGNRLKFGGGIPALNQLNGKLAFTRREIHSTGLTAEILGGPARLTVSGAVGGMRVDAQGSADVGLLRAQYPQQVLAARLTGTTDWQLALNVAPDRANWTLDTTLKGVAVDLPVPAAKPPSEALPLRIERRQTE